jgi:RNA polymerase sigma factor (TIGR02999 family)
LVGGDPDKLWTGRAHFFAAAAEAMRRILVENARSKHRLKRGGRHGRADIDVDELAEFGREGSDELLAVDGALDRLAALDPMAAELVKLRYFAGFTIAQAAEVLSISPRTADRLWAYARAWLRQAIETESR